MCFTPGAGLFYVIAEGGLEGDNRGDTDFDRFSHIFLICSGCQIWILMDVELLHGDSELEFGVLKTGQAVKCRFNFSLNLK